MFFSTFRFLTKTLLLSYIVLGGLFVYAAGGGESTQTHQFVQQSAWGTCTDSKRSCQSDADCEGGTDICQAPGANGCSDQFLCKIDGGSITNFCTLGSAIGDSCGDGGAGTCVGVCQSTIGNGYTSCIALPLDPSNCAANDPCVPYPGSNLSQGHPDQHTTQGTGACSECGNMNSTKFHAGLGTTLAKQQTGMCAPGFTLVPGSLVLTANGYDWRCALAVDGESVPGTIPDGKLTSCTTTIGQCGDGNLDEGCNGVCLGNASGGNPCNVDVDCAAGNTCVGRDESSDGFFCDQGNAGYLTGGITCLSCENGGDICRTPGNTCPNEECDDGNTDNFDGCTDQCEADNCFVWTGGSTTEVCSGSTAPSEIFFVLDKSGSMHGGSKLPDMKSAVTSFLNQMNPGTVSGGNIVGGSMVGLITFDSNDHTKVNPSTSNFSTVQTHVNQINAGGGTDIADGINAAASHLANGYTNNNQVIILLSDGSSAHSPAINAATAAKNNGIEIYTIALEASSSATTLLQNIATDSAHALESPSSSNLQLIFDMIANQIACQTVTNPPYLVNNCTDTCDNLYVDWNKDTNGDYVLQDVECVGYMDTGYNLEVIDGYGALVYAGGPYTAASVVSGDYFYNYYDSLSSITPLSNFYSATITNTPITVDDTGSGLSIYCYLSGNRADQCEFTIESTCGDGYVDPGEECDDGNTNEFDNCSSVCTDITPVCGNGTQEFGEQCDDDNTNPGDGCDENCAIEVACGSTGNAYTTIRFEGKMENDGVDHVNRKYITNTGGYDDTIGYGGYQLHEYIGFTPTTCEELRNLLLDRVANGQYYNPGQITIHECNENVYVGVHISGTITIGANPADCGTCSAIPPAANTIACDDGVPPAINNQSGTVEDTCSSSVACDWICDTGYVHDGNGNCVYTPTCGDSQVQTGGVGTCLGGVYDGNACGGQSDCEYKACDAGVNAGATCTSAKADCEVGTCAGGPNDGFQCTTLNAETVCGELYGCTIDAGNSGICELKPALSGVCDGGSNEECDNGKHCSDGSSCTLNEQCNGIGDNLCIPRSGDGCDNQCQNEGTTYCGDTIVQTPNDNGQNEECDDNAIAYDGCSSCVIDAPSCTIVSSFSSVNTGETITFTVTYSGVTNADWINYGVGAGNDTNVDTGTTQYQFSYANIGSYTTSFQVSNAYDGDFATCSTQVVVTAGQVCGNGKEELGEECDDNNNINGDGCSANCKDELCVEYDGTMGGILEKIDYLSFGKKSDINDVNGDDVGDVIIGAVGNAASIGPFTLAMMVFKSVSPYVLDALQVDDNGFDTLITNNAWLGSTIENMLDIYDDGEPDIGMTAYYDESNGTHGSARVVYEYTERTCSVP